MLYLCTPKRLNVSAGIYLLCKITVHFSPFYLATEFTQTAVRQYLPLYLAAEFIHLEVTEHLPSHLPGKFNQLLVREHLPSYLVAEFIQPVVREYLPLYLAAEFTQPVVREHLPSGGTISAHSVHDMEINYLTKGTTLFSWCFPFLSFS